MNFLTLILQSALVLPLVEFATSTSGHVEPREGLALGWLGSVVAGLAVVFGTAERTQADSCYGISAISVLHTARRDPVTLHGRCRDDAPLWYFRAEYHRGRRPEHPKTHLSRSGGA